MDSIPDDAEVIVTQKLHGKSIRIGHVPVNVQPTWKEKVAKFFGVNIPIGGSGLEIAVAGWLLKGV